MSTAATRETAVPRIRDGLRTCLWVFLGARLLLFVLSAIAAGSTQSLLPLPPNQPTGVPGWAAHVAVGGWDVLFTATERQDALWFLRIATKGYLPGDGSAAFFPLYPIAVRVVGWVPGLGPLGAALLVANTSFLGSLLMLHALTRLELGAEAVRRAVVFAALFPTAFFLMAPYTESLFLLLSVSAFWFARRNRWGWAAVVGILAAMTRSVGLLLIAGLAVEAARQWRRDGRSILPRLAASAAVAVGPLLYLAYWQVRFHDFWAPLDAQKNWGRRSMLPWTTLWRATDYAWRYRTYWLIDAIVVGLAIWGVARASRRVPAAYTVYAACHLALPLLEPYEPRPLLSSPRFVLVVFPMFWGFALAADRRRPSETALVGGFAAGYGLLAVLFMSWHYIF